ncbi:hypothetical protein TcCL_Unassigned02867, partial [Trypanosoma cruzi]
IFYSLTQETQRRRLFLANVAETDTWRISFVAIDDLFCAWLPQRIVDVYPVQYREMIPAVRHGPPQSCQFALNLPTGSAVGCAERASDDALFLSRLIAAWGYRLVPRAFQTNGAAAFHWAGEAPGPVWRQAYMPLMCLNCVAGDAHHDCHCASSLQQATTRKEYLPGMNCKRSAKARGQETAGYTGEFGVPQLSSKSGGRVVCENVFSGAYGGS